MPKSPMVTTVEPDWYIGHRTKPIGDYFGSFSSIVPGETYVTQDTMYIVHRDPETHDFSVSRNACAHAGALLLSETGVQDVGTIRCPIHRWAYKPDGTCTSAPNFSTCEGVRLAAPEFGVWNGYVLGYPQAALDDGLANFGAELGVSAGAFNPSNFIFMEEDFDELPYPRELMKINYDDGYHVAPYHPKTFGAVANPATYRWEVSEYVARHPVWYSIQEVREHSDVHKRVSVLMDAYGATEDSLGWGHFHQWVEEHLVKRGVQHPIDRDVFALWAAIYGNSHLMPELYMGGLFLAVSYLVNVDPDNPRTGNRNYVEYYVHKNVPDELRNTAYRLFRRAYGQSAREDDEICLRLWAAHQRGAMGFSRAYHTVLERGDEHWRNWFLNHFLRR